MNIFGRNEQLWVINKKLYGKKRLAIIILFESAGMIVHEPVKLNIKGFTSKEYPYLGGYNTYAKVVGWRKKVGHEIDYKVAIKELIKIIKERK